MPTPPGAMTNISPHRLDLLELDLHGIHLGKFFQADRNAGYGPKYRHRHCFPGMLSFLHGGGELLLAARSSAGRTTT